MLILITGATGGIGEKITQHLATHHQVIALARSQENLDKLNQQLGQKLTTISVDISKRIPLQKALSRVKNLDVLINCAAVLKPVGPFLENDLKEWRETLEINLLGTVYTCYFALPLLLKSPRGKIINFSGGGSAYSRLFHTAYASSKTAVVRFTEILADEYPNLNINVIAPGAYKTKMWKDETADPEPEKWGDMERLKNFIDFLVSEKSDGINGKFIHYKDNWEDFTPKTLSKDIYTLRRIEK